MRGVVLLVLLLLAVDAIVSADQFDKAWTDNFYIDKINFMTIFEPMKKEIEGQHDRNWDLADGSKNPVLKKQNLGKNPEFWFMPFLFGHGLTRTQLAIRNDNLYLSAFTNSAGKWFHFKPQRGQYVVKDSTLLSFGNQYNELLDKFPEKGSGKEAWEKLEGLDIGQTNVLDAIKVVGEYNPKTTPEKDIKEALVVLIVVFIESQRFPHIRQLVHDAWMKGHGYLDKKGAELVVNWKDISCAILIWDAFVSNGEEPRWDSKEAEDLKKTGLGITTPESAKAEIWPIIQGKCSE